MSNFLMFEITAIYLVSIVGIYTFPLSGLPDDVRLRVTLFWPVYAVGWLLRSIPWMVKWLFQSFILALRGELSH